MSSDFGPVDAGPSTRSARSWRGRRADPKKVVRHRWQRDWTAQQGQRPLLQSHKRRLKIGGLLALGGGLIAYYLWLLLFAPVQTPFIAVASSLYDWPLPPNAWAREDLDGYLALDGETLRVVDVGAASRSREQILRGLEEQLRLVARHGTRSETLIISLSMHGAVNGRNEPCLIPPGASPLNADTWIPVAEILDLIRVQNLPAELNKLLILDANRMHANWHLGLLCNTFAERLQETVERKLAEESAVSNLFVLNSTSPGEQGWASPHLQHSAFGSSLQTGLAGAADDVREGGNADRHVSLRELHSYLTRHVNAWAQHNRGTCQHPMLLPANARDVHVVWSLRSSNRPAPPEPVLPEISAEEITALWNDREEIARLGCVRLDPLAWRNIEHRLLWIEQLADAGPGYASLARRTHDELKTSLAGMRQRAADGTRPIPVRWDVFSREPVQIPSDLAAPSLPLANKFGVIPPARLSALDGALARAVAAPDPAALADIVAGLNAVQPPIDTSETQLLRLIQRFQQANPPAAESVQRILDLRRQAELAAAPDDERTLPWIRPLIDAGDRSRRAAEDRLFSSATGGSAVPPAPLGDDILAIPAPPKADFDQLASDAEQAYTRATQLSLELADAFATRDRIAAELPYLAGWLIGFVSQPREPGHVTDLDEAELEHALFELIAGNHRLSSALATPPAAESADEAAFTLPLEDARQNFTLLRGIYDAACAEALDATRSEGRLCCELLGLLEVPLLPAGTGDRSPVSQRAALRLLAARMSAELQRDLAAVPVKASRGNTATTPGFEDSRALEHVLDRWQQHPALAILEPDQPPPAAPPAVDHSKADDSPNDLSVVCAQSGQRVRHALATLTLPSIHPAAAMPEGDRRGASGSTTALRRAADRIRTAAAFAFPPPDDEPVGRFRQHQLQALALWHCQRVVDDFYGPARIGEPSYFEAASTAMLRTLETWLPTDSSLRGELESLRALQAYRRRAAAGALRVLAESLLLVPEADQAATTVAVRAADPMASTALPAGEATVFLADSAGMLGPASRSLLLPLDGQNGTEFSYRFEPRALRARGPAARAVAWFRGHEFATDVMMSVAGGVTITTVPQSFNSARVTLEGDNRKPASLVFVLDCSASMRETMVVEGVRARVPRLSVAKNALIRMLQEVARQKEMRAGVVFYGHRVGWTTEADPKRRAQSDYARPIPEDLQPYEDVEAVLPLGRFDLTEASAVASILESVVPWGETPLYLSISEALRQFDGDDPNAQRSIIVVTDGVNYQRNPPFEKSPGLAQVVSEARRQNVEVHVVGFGIPAGEQREAQTSFRTIAEQTGGSYETPESATMLVDTLLSHLGPTSYTLRDAEGRSAEAEIGSSLTLERTFESPLPYTVAGDGLETAIELRGGEDLRLQLAETADRIEIEPYRRGPPRTGRLVANSSGGDTGVTLTAHPPLRYDRGIEFELSLARDDRNFIARPVEVWVEITPVQPEGEPPAASYLFYDATYVPGTSVPVLKFRAEDWPRNAASARIDCWCKWAETDPILRLPLVESARNAAGELEGNLVPGVPGVKVMHRVEQGEQLAVHVVEVHTSESPGLFSVRVDVDGMPRPQQIVRRYDRINGIVTHTFVYGAAAAESLPKGHAMIATRLACQRESRRLRTPILVDVSAAGDVIVVPPPLPAR